MGTPTIALKVKVSGTIICECARCEHARDEEGCSEPYGFTEYHIGLGDTEAAATADALEQAYAKHPTAAVAVSGTEALCPSQTS